MTTKIKKIGILLFAILTAAGIMAMYIANNSAFANNASTNNLKNYIGEDRAKEIALKDAGVSETDATYLHAHLDRDDRIIDYDVEFYCDGKEYDYEINAYTGDILEKSIERERIPDYSSQSPAVNTAPQANSAPQVEATPPATTQPSNNTYYYDDDYYDDDWDDRYDDDRYDDDWDDRYDDWDDRYDDDWDDDWDD